MKLYSISDLTLDNCGKDLVNGLVIGDGVVEDKEVPLESLCHSSRRQGESWQTGSSSGFI